MQRSLVLCVTLLRSVNEIMKSSDKSQTFEEITLLWGGDASSIALISYTVKMEAKYFFHYLSHFDIFVDILTVVKATWAC